MIGTVRAYIHQKLTPMLADKVAEGNFASVLKWVRKPIASTESWAVYNNIFRIIALHGSDRDDWVTELGFLNADNKLDVFGQDEKNYIFLYMLDRLFGEIDIYPRIKLSKVSDATLQYFPIDTKSAKFEKYFPLPTSDQWLRHGSHLDDHLFRCEIDI